MRLSRAPGRLDVMGGIADYTGSLVCELPLDRAAAVVVQERVDRQVQVFSFNLYDEHQPFTFRMPLDALVTHPAEVLHKEFSQPGRKWAGYIVGCLFMLHERGYLDLKDPAIRGLNIAVESTVSMGAGVASSAAIEVATMMNMVDHFAGNSGHWAVGSVRPSETRNPKPEARGLNPWVISSLCQAVENRIVGAPCGIMDQVTSCLGEAGTLLQLLCQPHTLLPALRLPAGVRVVGINSAVKHSVGGGMYGKTRCAAFMGHRIILEQMRQLGQNAGRTLEGDPMNGYLANLHSDDYKRLFRSSVPEMMKGLDFLEKYGPTIDQATVVHPDHEYHVRQATDHHVFENRRVRHFVEFLEQAGREPADSAQRRGLLNKAGHLMYASHRSYTDSALLGAPECDLLVQLVRDREGLGFYGAKITGGGSGGTVAILADAGERTDTGIEQIMHEYEKQTGHKPEAFLGTSPGAWTVGTTLWSATT